MCIRDRCIGVNNKPSLLVGEPPKPVTTNSTPISSAGATVPLSSNYIKPALSPNGTVIRTISSTATNSVICSPSYSIGFTSTLPSTSIWTTVISAENVVMVLPSADNVPVAISYDNGNTWSTGGTIPYGTQNGSKSNAVYTNGVVAVYTQCYGNSNPYYNNISVSYDLGLTWGATAGVTYAPNGPGIMLAGDDGQIILMSPTSPNFNVFAVGGTGGLSYNTSLNSTTIPAGGYWSAGIYGINSSGNGVYVVINSSTTAGPAGAIYANSIGPNTWNVSNLPLSTWQDIIYNGGYFITMNSTGSIAYSRDGVSWTVSTGFDTGVYALSSWYGQLMTFSSTTLKTHLGTLPVSAMFVTALNGSRILAADTLGSTGVMYSDDNGNTWNQSGMTLVNRFSQITSDNGNVVVGIDSGGIINYSTNGGAFWTQNGGYSGFSTLYFKGGKFIASGGGKGVWISFDGVDWTQDATANTVTMNSFSTGS